MATNKRKNKKNNKYATAQKEKLSASDFFIGFGKWETISFCVGLLIGVFALFMLVAFVSYLFTGEADFSLLGSDFLGVIDDIYNLSRVGSDIASFKKTGDDFAVTDTGEYWGV